MIRLPGLSSPLAAHERWLILIKASHLSDFRLLLLRHRRSDVAGAETFMPNVLFP